MFNTVQLHLTYIWLDSNCQIRQTVKIIENKYEGEVIIHRHDLNRKSLSHIVYMIPNIYIDGSETNQSTSDNFEILLNPQVCYILPDNKPDKDGFIRLLILSDCHIQIEKNNYVPHPENTRHKAHNIFNQQHKNTDGSLIPITDIVCPLYTIKHNFIVHTSEPIKINSTKFYCIDSLLEHIINEIIIKSHLMELNILGYFFRNNNEIEIHIQNYGLTACDDLIILRYLVNRIFSQYNYTINTDNTINTYVNYSDSYMRGDAKSPLNYSPYEHIMYSISQLEKNHSECTKFTYGIANKNVSICIPKNTHFEQKGHIEDRRSSNNFDPYKTLSDIYKTITEGIYPSN